MADASDLGSDAPGVEVQVLLSAPNRGEGRKTRPSVWFVQDLSITHKSSTFLLVFISMKHMNHKQDRGGYWEYLFIDGCICQISRPL